MNRTKKTVLTLMILAAMPLVAAENKTIYVTTFEDQDGEDESQCSLREAIKAAELNRAYGGCTAGETVASVRDVIQLKEGTYRLNSELTPGSAVTILGAVPQDYSKINVITNNYPAKTALLTKIDAQGKGRILNTSQNNTAISLTNVQLQNARSSGRGGALYLGGTTELNNIAITDSAAAVGGAIYLEGINSSLTSTSSLFQGNNSNNASVLGMSCMDNLVSAQRVLNFSYNSFIGNGNQNTQSTIELCGNPVANFNANTIARNTASPAQGSILKFTSDRFNASDESKLAVTSSLNLQSNTIVENNAFSTLLYDQIGSKNLSFNILAFNSNKSCRYMLGAARDQKNLNIQISNNALSLSDNAISQCDLPRESVADTTRTLDMSNTNIRTVLSELQAPSQYTAFLPMYFPIDTRSNLDFVDVETTGCSLTDQRGINRITESTLILNPANRNSCDIGSTEILRLTAADVNALTNLSQVTIIDNYQRQYDFYKELVENPNTNADFLPFYRQEVSRYQGLLNYTKANPKYRPIFIDPFQYSLPDETVLANGGREIRHFNTENYNVETKMLGVGSILTNGDQPRLDVRPDDRLKCEWRADLKQIMMYRVDDGITQAGDYNFCQYTLTAKDANGQPNSAKQSSGILQATFNNIAPVSKNREYLIQYGGAQRITVNLLENANDDGDGNRDALSNRQNKPAFYHTAQGEELAVRLINLPSGIEVNAARTGACPGLDSRELCYGGPMTIEVKNNYNLFDYSFRYVVYDADGARSNEATITLKNSASTPNNQSSGGGGSVGLLGLFTLIFAAGYRYKRRGNSI